MEDIYTTQFHKYLTFFMDSVTNFEFFGHPHTNKTDKEWRIEFKNLGFRIQEVRIHGFWYFFTSATYVLEKK
jgi:hypothetical protein